MECLDAGNLPHLGLFFESGTWDSHSQSYLCSTLYGPTTRATSVDVVHTNVATKCTLACSLLGLQNVCEPQGLLIRVC